MQFCGQWTYNRKPEANCRNQISLRTPVNSWGGLNNVIHEKRATRGWPFLTQLTHLCRRSYGVSLLTCVDQLPSAPRVPPH
jgi:hypothetical protein